MADKKRGRVIIQVSEKTGCTVEHHVTEKFTCDAKTLKV